MIRPFRVATCEAGTVVHDPATGLTYQCPRPLPTGRQLLHSHDVAAWPVIHPSACGRDMPISVCWSPIVRCNLSCPHCLDDKTVPERGPDERLRIAALIGAADVYGVDISGGEPLLLGDLTTLAGTLTAAGCVVSVTTNGWHLSRRAGELAEHLDAVRVSLDGPSRLVHDGWRGSGSFDRAVDGIKAAVAAGLRVHLQSVLMASTRRFAQDLVYLAHRLGAGGVTFLQMLPIGEGAQRRQEMLSDEVAQTVVADLYVPEDLTVRLRTRAGAGGFTVIRADGQVWRNDRPAGGIDALRPLRDPADLALSGPDGSA